MLALHPSEVVHELMRQVVLRLRRVGAADRDFVVAAQGELRERARTAWGVSGLFESPDTGPLIPVCTPEISAEVNRHEQHVEAEFVDDGRPERGGESGIYVLGAAAKRRCSKLGKGVGILLPCVHKRPARKKMIRRG